MTFVPEYAKLIHFSAYAMNAAHGMWMVDFVQYTPYFGDRLV